MIPNWYIFFISAVVIFILLALYIKYLFRRQSKGIKWLYKSSTLIIFLGLLLNAIALVFIWGIFSDAEVLTAVTTISLIVTIIFIQQSINESRRYNKIAIYQDLSNDFKKEIENLCLKSEKELFTEDESKAIAEQIGQIVPPNYGMGHYGLYLILAELLKKKE